jgi:hypothetical protein
MRTQHTPDASTKAQVEEIFIRLEKTATNTDSRTAIFRHRKQSVFTAFREVVPIPRGQQSIFSISKVLAAVRSRPMPFQISNLQLIACYVSENLNESPISVHNTS